MTRDDPYLRMSDHQYRDLLPAYEPDDALGWVPRLLIGVTAALVGAGVGVVVVGVATWRRLLG